MFLSTVVTSMVVTTVSVPILSRLALRVNLVDIPNKRKIHTQPIPLIGGLAISLGVLLPVLFWIGNDPFVRCFVADIAVIAIFGTLDDLIDLSPPWKLVGQAVVAGIAVFLGGVQITSLWMFSSDPYVLPSWLSFPLTIIIIMAAMNAINLSDGLDGLAGGICLLSLCCIGYLAYLQQQITLIVITLAVVGANAAFLRHNTYPADVFMGEVGSQLLGFSCITLGIQMTQDGPSLSPILPMVILGFPLLDMLSVSIQRIIAGRSPFAADKIHFHHTLLTVGLTQRQAVLLIYILQTILIGIALLFRSYRDDILLGAYLLFSLPMLLFFFLARHEKWQVQVEGPADWIGSPFRTLRNGEFIRFLFRPLHVMALALLLITALLSHRPAPSMSVTALCSIIVIALLARLRQGALVYGLKTVLCVVIPLIVVNRSSDGLGLISSNLLYISFGLLAVLTFLVSRLSRRRQCHRVTPFDFLVLVITLTVPFLVRLDPPTSSSLLTSGKILIFYYSCQILFAELRGNFRSVTFTTLSVLGILAGRGLITF